MIASWSWLSTLEVGFFGPIRASEAKSRHLHLAIVLRLTPYRSARTMSFSSLAWIARRILGVVVVQVWVRLRAARPPFCATRGSLQSPCDISMRQQAYAACPSRREDRFGR